MKKRSPLSEYFRRLFQQTWLLVTGGVGFLVSLIAGIFFPNSYILVVYLVIFIVGIFVGGYFAFVDLLSDYEKLEEKIIDIENRKPDINVFLKKRDGQTSNEIVLRLNPVAPKPDYDELVERKRKKLMAKLSENRGAFGLLGSALYTVNKNYDQEVKEYLIKYKEHLMRVYECSIDRAYAIYPFVENRGQYPANNVTIEFIMPPEFEEPSEHHCFDRTTTIREQIEYYTYPPSEPQPFIDFSSIALAHSFPEINSVASNYQGQPHISGPDYEKKDGKVHIKYKIEKLVQHNPENDFEPIWVWLGNVEQTALWKVSVRITSSDLRKPEEDILLINIEKP